MTAPKLGYLCLSENPSNEAGRAIIRQFVLVREAERMGYDDIWLAEHHFDGQWPQGGALALLGQLAAACMTRCCWPRTSPRWTSCPKGAFSWVWPVVAP
jgi:hypothetical protein